MKKSYTYDDVCLIPQYNNISSRVDPEIDLSAYLFKRGQLKLDIPILASNMDTVICTELADIMHYRGSIPIFHRFADFETKLKWAKEFGVHMILSIGVNSEDIADAYEIIIDRNIELGGLCIDVAHGHSEQVLNTLKQFKKDLPSVPIIAGNICTSIAAHDLINCGADCLKVGIGPGSCCSTRLKTGVGMPQFYAVQECSEIAKKFKVPVIADGGIEKPADVAKALAAGASCVMIGKMFAATKESAAQKKRSKAKYRGQASKDFQDDYKGGLKNGTVAEGESFWIPVTGTAEELIDELVGSLRSSFTYMGAKHLGEFQSKACFREVLPSYIKESSVRK